MTFTRYIPDFIMVAVGVYVAFSGRRVRATQERLEALHTSVSNLVQSVYSFALRVDALERRSLAVSDASLDDSGVEDTSDFQKRLGALSARYCRVRGVDGVVLPFGTILQGDESAYGVLEACGPGWARFSTGYYTLTGTKKESNDL